MKTLNVTRCVVALVFATGLGLGGRVAVGQEMAAGSDNYHAEMQAGMKKMHEQMMAAPMTGNPDIDFAAMMIPHHQGAVDMAKTELKYGKDDKLRELAKKIIESQEKEIGEMQERLAKLKKSGASGNMGTSSTMHGMPGMH